MKKYEIYNFSLETSADVDLNYLKCRAGLDIAALREELNKHVITDKVLKLLQELETVETLISSCVEDDKEIKEMLVWIIEESDRDITITFDGRMNYTPSELVPHNWDPVFSPEFKGLKVLDLFRFRLNRIGALI